MRIEIDFIYFMYKRTFSLQEKINKKKKITKRRLDPNF